MQACPIRYISAPVRASSSDATSYPFSPCGLVPHILCGRHSALNNFHKPSRCSGAVARLGSRVRSRSLVRSTLLQARHSTCRPSIRASARSPLPKHPPGVCPCRVTSAWQTQSPIKPARGCDSRLGRLPWGVIRACGFTSSPNRYAELPTVWPSRSKTLRACGEGSVCHVRLPALPAQ